MLIRTSSRMDGQFSHWGALSMGRIKILKATGKIAVVRFPILILVSHVLRPPIGVTGVSSGLPLTGFQALRETDLYLRSSGSSSRHIPTPALGPRRFISKATGFVVHISGKEKDPHIPGCRLNRSWALN